MGVPGHQRAVRPETTLGAGRLVAKGVQTSAVMGGAIERSDPFDRGPGAADSWALGIAKSALLLALSVVAFVLVPDRLLVLLSTRVSPRVRDTLVLLWVIVAFVGLAWAFVTAQRWRRP
jgi:hypothetical protein